VVGPPFEPLAVEICWPSVGAPALVSLVVGAARLAATRVTWLAAARAAVWVASGLAAGVVWPAGPVWLEVLVAAAAAAAVVEAVVEAAVVESAVVEAVAVEAGKVEVVPPRAAAEPCAANACCVARPTSVSR
jgi:hypothetical protein